MALFGGQRDISLFKSVNKEIIHRYIDTEVLVYRLNLQSTTTNIYDETDSKLYDEAILIPCLASLEDQAWSSEDYGSEVNQAGTFAFLTDDLNTFDFRIQVGDIIEHKSRFFEIDAIVDNQSFLGKNPANWFGGDSHGWNVSIICQAHMTRQSKVNIVKTRFGNSEPNKNKTLPKNL